MDGDIYNETDPSRLQARVMVIVSRKILPGIIMPMKFDIPLDVGTSQFGEEIPKQITDRGPKNSQKWYADIIICDYD